MLSLTHFRTHLLSIFRVMIDTKQPFEVSYKGVVYDVYVERTDKPSTLVRAKRTTKNELMAIEADECPGCGGIRFQGVCMDTDCPLASTIPSNKTTNNN